MRLRLEAYFFYFLFVFYFFFFFFRGFLGIFFLFFWDFLFFWFFKINYFFFFLKIIIKFLFFFYFFWVFCFFTTSFYNVCWVDGRVHQYLFLSLRGTLRANDFNSSGSIVTSMKACLQLVAFVNFVLLTSVSILQPCFKLQ